MPGRPNDDDHDGVLHVEQNDKTDDDGPRCAPLRAAARPCCPSLSPGLRGKYAKSSAGEVPAAWMMRCMRCSRCGRERPASSHLEENSLPRDGYHAQTAEISHLGTVLPSWRLAAPHCVVGGASYTSSILLGLMARGAGADAGRRRPRQAVACTACAISYRFRFPSSDGPDNRHGAVSNQERHHLRWKTHVRLQVWWCQSAGARRHCENRRQKYLVLCCNASQYRRAARCTHAQPAVPRIDLNRIHLSPIGADHALARACVCEYSPSSDIAVELKFYGPAPARLVGVTAYRQMVPR